MNSEFLLRRIHSITGIFPVGIFLVYHLFTQLYLHSGAEVYNEHTNAFYDSPMAMLLLAIFVYIPLFFHSIYGLKLSNSLLNVSEVGAQTEYRYLANVLYWLQRLSGVGVFLFIGAHLTMTQLITRIEGEYGMHYEHLQAGFLNPDSGLVTLAVYVLGILGASFHFSNGINTFCITWGITLTPLSQKMVRNFSIGVFIALTMIGYYSISVLYLH